jgi:outer membrane protein insertion porin family
VVERPTGSFSFGAGYSSRDSFILTGSLSEQNFLGRGYSLNLSADLSRRNQRYYLQFQDNYFLGSNFSFGGSVYRTSVRFDDFSQERNGIELSLGHTLSEDHAARGFISYQLSSRDIEQTSSADASALIYREILGGKATSSAIALQLTVDRRNDRISPTAGYEMSGVAEYAGIGGFERHAKFEGRASYFLPAPSWLLEGSSFGFRTSMGYVVPLNDLDDYTWNISTDIISPDGQVRSLDQVDTDLTLPLSERYFLGGLGNFQLRGYEARSVGPRALVMRKYIVKTTGGWIEKDDVVFAPVGVNPLTGKCEDDGNYGGNGNGLCNRFDEKIVDIDETDVVGGSKFITASVEYRFPISDTLGLQGVFFLDAGNAFSEDENMFDVTEWRWGTGGGLLWFSPFGPLAAILGVPLNPTSVDKARVFEFSVGGQGF